MQAGQKQIARRFPDARSFNYALGCLESAVAMLEFLAGPAWARLIAADVTPRGRISRITLVRGDNSCRCRSKRYITIAEIVLAGRYIDVLAAKL